MTDTTQKLTHLLPSQIPDYVQEFYPLFVIFVTKYFEYLQDTSTGVQTTLQNLQLNRDIDTTASNLARQFLHSYLPGLPDTSAADQTVLVKYFRQFYQLKGSPESFRLFFKAFYDDNIDVEYPRNVLFKTSDGRWYNEQSIRVQKLSGDPINLSHTYVTGNTSGAYAIVDDVISINGLGAVDQYDLIIQTDTTRGTFTTGETIQGIYYDYDLNLSSVVTATSITGLNIAPGRYLNSYSQLSSDQLLQDSLYYQQFSYVLRTHEDRTQWYDTVLRQLHPAGLAIFNNYSTDQIADFSSGQTTSIAINTEIRSTIKIPVQKTYLTSPTFTFDRTADEQTGTSTTQVATTTGFTTITYTSIGSIVRDGTYDYPGLHVTWALQNLNDTSYAITELIALGGPSFDKFSRFVGLTDEITTWPQDVNTSIVVTRATLISSNLTAGTLLTSFSSQTLTYNSALANATSVGSMILIVNWVKNSQGNNAAGESSNAVVISFSSNVAVIPYFGDETQRNFQHVHKNDALSYAKLTYFHSSNSIQTNITPDIPFTSTTLTGQAGQIVFKPYNWERGVSYDRATIRFEIDKSLQAISSLTETFETDNITSTVISSWSGSTASSIRFTSTATQFYSFSSNAFVFNGTSTQSRYLQTVTFPNCAQLDANLKYLVGDGYNGGEIPDASEDLEIQYQLGAGTIWYTAHKLWIGSTSNLWTYGTTSLAGQVFVQVSSNTVTGFGTLFGTTLNIGDIITINSSLTTGYTITNIINNNSLQVTPSFVDNFLGLVTSTGTVTGGTGGSSLSGTGTLFDTQFVLGDIIALSSASTTTAYTITNIANSSNISITPALTDNFSSSIFYKIAGVPAFRKLPAGNQFNQTSVTVYGPGPTTSVVMRIIQNSQTQLNDDVYAVDDLTVQSFNYQASTGVVNISVAVSSNSTLNINDTDFFTITTIGT